jgi:hypothetical protein
MAADTSIRRVTGDDLVVDLVRGAMETTQRTGGLQVCVVDERGGRAARGVLVARSLLLTCRSVVATPVQAPMAHVIVPPAGRSRTPRPVGLDPDAAFVTSPALGWTLVGIHGAGLGFQRISRLDGFEVAGRVRSRWVTREQLLADLRPRLHVLGGQGQRLAAELGLQRSD